MQLHGYLRVKSSAYRYLMEHVDPQKNLLVFLWGSFGSDTHPHWIVSVSRRSTLPPNAVQQGHWGELLNGIPFVIVQPEHAPKLNGCTLVYEGGALVIRSSGNSLPGWKDQQYPTDEHRILASSTTPT